MFYHDNQSKCLFLISLCSLRHNTWIYISSIDKPLYSILYLLNFPVVWKKCPAFSLLFYPYFSFISETAVSEVFYAILNSLLVLGFCCFCVCRILLLKAKKLFLLIAEAISENLFFLNHAQKSSEACFYFIVMREKNIAIFHSNHRNVSSEPSQWFTRFISML